MYECMNECMNLYLNPAFKKCFELQKKKKKTEFIFTFTLFS